jgi:hypothetical protein
MSKIKLTVFLCALIGLSAFSQELSPFENNGKFGVKNEKGKIIAEAKYDEIDCCNECYYGTIAFRIKQNGKYGFLNQDAKEVIPAIYEATGFCWQGTYFSACLNGKWGFIDATGKAITPFKYDKVEEYKGGITSVSMGGKWDSVSVNDYNEYGEQISVKKRLLVGSKWGAINESGKEIISFIYNEPFEFYGNDDNLLAKVSQNGKYGYINSTGKIVIPFKYEDATFFSEGIALVQQNGKYGFINESGKEITPCKYDGYSIFPNDGPAPMKFNNKWGYVDCKTGKEIIPFLYDEAGSFINESAQVKLNNQSFRIDKTGNKLKQ